jgi:CubicO group peptidase (beta-lactamase class C family)
VSSQRLHTVAAVVLAFGLAATGSAQAQSEPEIGARLDKIFAEAKAGQTPGCAVGVQPKGRAPILRAYGDADLEHDVRNRTDTVFEAGSSSKQFTAAAILRLVEQGRLALSDDVRKYVPELPVYERPITLDNLLHHTSGLRDWGGVEAYAGWPRTSRIYVQQDVLDVAVRQKHLNFAPGEAFSYTNTGYNLLAIVAERVSGKSLQDFEREQFFAPLGMSRTQWRDDFRRVVKDRAVAYSPTAAGFGQVMPFESTYGHGGLLTTVGDLLKWNAALADGKLGPIVTQGLAERGVLASGRKINYARAQIWADYKGHAELAHPGATAGYTAWVGRFPDDGLSIALLCNSAASDSEALAHAVADIFLADRSPPRPAFQPGPKVEGLFIDEVAGIATTVEAADGKVKLGDGQELAAISATDYAARGNILHFEGPERFTLADPYGGVARYRRGASAPVKVADLSVFTGRYLSTEADATYTVTVQADHLLMTLQGRAGMSFPLAPLYTDAFSLDGVLVRFDRDGSGKVAGLRLSGDRVLNLQFDRVGDR